MFRYCSIQLAATAFQARSFNHAPAPFSKNATWHNARHRHAQEFRAIFTSVPKRFQLQVRNRQCFRVILKDATVRKTVASANIKFQSAKC